jgi:tetratricopeptide (TPR) repeat protein
MRVQPENTGGVLLLEGEPLGRGGEAEVYALPDRPQQVAKIYRQPTPARADKLAAMIARPPQPAPSGSGYVAIAWPVERLLAVEGTRQVVGYLMPRVQKALLFQQVLNPKVRQALAPNFSCLYLLRTARNLAAAVKAIHDAGHVIGDLNESNILVSASALISLVDTDSFQVTSGSQVFRCRVGKMEYTSPELQNQNLPDVERRPAHDNFGLAVLIFQLLMQGVHPFGGSFTGGSVAGGLGDWIAEGWWPYSLERNVPFKPRPTAPPWDVLPAAVQALFLRCFDDGHRKPEQRPTAREWAQALTEVEAQLQECPTNRLHFYPRQSETCPWCRMVAAQGRDCFPLPGSAPAVAAQAPPPQNAAPEAPPPRRRSAFRAAGCLLALVVLGAGAVGYGLQREQVDPLVADWLAKIGISQQAAEPQTPPPMADEGTGPSAPVAVKNAEPSTPSEVVAPKKNETTIPKTEPTEEPAPPVPYVSLFNGKDLAGWEPGPLSKTHWEVKDGILTGSGPAGYLYSERGDYENFHFRVEARINSAGNSGQFFRAQHPLGVPPRGYEAQIALGDRQKTGSLYNLVKIAEPLHKPDEWFTQEVIADGDHISILVNDRKVVDALDKSFRKGHFALQVNDPATVVQFRKIEVKELLPLEQAQAKNWHALGQVASRRHEVDQAIADFNEAIRLDPKMAEAYASRGTAYHLKKETDRAAADFREALRLDPKLAQTHTDRGLAFREEQDYDRAIAQFTVALRLDPRLAPACLARGATYVLKGESNPAIADLDEAIRLDTNVAAAYLSRGNAYLLKKETGRATADFREAGRLDPQLARSYFDRAHACREKKDYDQAIAQFTLALRLDPSYALAYFGRGWVHVLKREYEPAIADLNEAIRLDPKSARAVNERGWAYYQIKEYDRALRDFDEALRLDAAYVTAYFNRALCLRQRKDYDRAIADYTEIIRISPTSTVALNSRGWTYYLKKDYDRAIKDFDQTIRLDAKHATAYVNRAICFQEKKDEERALAAYSEIIRLFPESVPARKSRGLIYLEKKAYDAAIADFTEAIRLDPSSASHFNNRGICYYRKLEYDTAVADYQEAIRLDSKYVFAHHNYGQVLNAKKDFDGAIAEFTEAIRLDPKYVNAYLSRGVAHANKKDYDKAIASLDSAIKLDPKNARAYLERSRAHAKKGNRAQADADRAKALQLDPNIGK